MDRKYYVTNLVWGVMMFCVCACAWYSLPGKGESVLSKEVLFYGMSAMLYPLSKKFIEDVALGFTSKEFWNKGLFKESTAKNSMYVMYYAFCYIAAIPLSTMFALRFFYKDAIGK
ncbi:hypothetical protein B1219_30665 [Pseudomonas ogarae]|uniref:colicin E1 family microcin immunity protein n=1 Tax=Pseudomonas ogarae (strain DSM 112162 / CECT 30235 / F113) TaxID=1114970 RepID=UPI0009A43349|nr:hypothetical protein B1219_30665 [Pseudomonas ogarae]OPG78941.1 hypothetical protein B1218_12930 [Pseudomonas ogarae]PBJ05131.1 Colicin E1 (microcin) immunity protein [Pseudomonas ogarae]